MSNRRTAKSQDDPIGCEQPAQSGLPDIHGDPGVGGLLADPQVPAAPRTQRPAAAGSASPDPEPPKAHGDWLPTHKSLGRPAR